MTTSLTRAEPALGWQWEDDALCATIDPELWFPMFDERKSANRARAFCRSCPVRAQCLSAALSAKDPPEGIWGATSERQRRPLRAAVGRGEAVADVVAAVLGVRAAS